MATNLVSRLSYAWLCAVIGVALHACGDDTSSAADASVDGSASGPGAGASATPDSCGNFGRDDPCATCLASECCVAGAACASGEACVALVTCARECDAMATACRANCADDAPSGRGPYNELVLCMANQCTDECFFATP